LNPGSSKLEVYSKSDEMLWDIPVTGIEAARMGEAHDGLPRVAVADLDGNGSNEVIATLESIGGSAARNVSDLFVLSGKREVLAHISGYRTLRFRGEVYTDVHPYGGLIVWESGGDGSKEIICRSFSGRSPMGLLRYNKRGEILGEYWHFGHLTELLAADFNGDGKRELLLAGSNDSESTGDFGSGEFIILDPGKIIGATEATVSRGFGFSPSTAERAAVRLPNSPQNLRYRSKAGIASASVETANGERLLRIWWTANLPDGRMDLEYIFGSDLRLKTVRSSDTTARLLAALQQKGENSPDENAGLLASLRDGVSYWDGHSWQKEPPLSTPRTP
jgi:hypothetical protein